mmetsp:Transcript_2598/g.4916  ORF Transcript_2598/g.4916 Transcript_2598/m.4916 type:complete len:1010 (+) Transcript_2598:83-3112(+)
MEKNGPPPPPPPPSEPKEKGSGLELSPMPEPTQTLSNPVAQQQLENINLASSPPSPDPPKDELTNSSAGVTGGGLGDIDLAPPPQTPDPPKDDGVVIQCSMVYSFLTFLITSAYTTLSVRFAMVSKLKLVKFYSWILLPIATTALVLSFALQPRLNSKRHLAFLALQFSTSTWLCEWLTVVGFEWDSEQIFLAVIRSFGWAVTLVLGLRVRARIARLPDKDLSKFLVDKVFSEGFLVGLGQLIFLVFSSIQCDTATMAEGEGWENCRRTLYSQTGLGCLTALVIVLRLVSGVVPPKIMKRHVLGPDRIVTMDLSVKEFFEFCGLCAAAGCGLFLISLYGAEGNFGSHLEFNLVKGVMTFGGVSLSVTALWKGIVIRGEMKRERLGAPGTSTEARAKPAIVVTRGSVFWWWLGVFATTFQSFLFAASAVTLEAYWITISATVLPLVAVFYIGAFFADPSAQDRRSSRRILLHFCSFSLFGQLCWFIYEWRSGNAGMAMTHIARAALELFFFRVALKIRRGIGQLPHAELHGFLVDTLFKGGLATMASILFITFRATKCVFEHNLEKCEETALSSNFICLFIILKWWMALVRSSIPLVMRRRVVLRVDRLVTMNVSMRQKIQLACLTVCGCCGIWLFAMMDNEEKNGDWVMVVGTTGCGAVATAVVLEARRVHEVQLRSTTSAVTAATAAAAVEEQPLVSEASWLWIGLSGAMAIVTFALNVVYSIELGRWWIYGQMLAPLSGASLALALFLKPRNETVLYKRVLYLHFSTFVLLREGAFLVGLFRRGIVAYAVECVLRICALSFLFWKGLALREVVAQLDDGHLSEYITEVVFNGGYNTLVALVFFCFETISCLGSTTEELDVGNNNCTNTSAASAALSNFIAVFTMQKLVSMARAKHVRDSHSVTYDDLATMTLTWVQSLQGACIMVTLVCSMYLFSFVGIQSNFNQLVYTVGFVGFICVSLSLTLEMYVMRKAVAEKKSGASSTVAVLRSRAVSTGKINDGMFVGALV